MRTFAVVFAILFAAVAAQAQLSRGECMGRCVLCGDDPVCATIYENCIHTCMTNGKKAPPPLPDVWGAIAVSPSALVQGHSWNYKSEEEARQRALKECAASTVAKDCKVVVTVADVCVALAISKPERIYTIGGP
ncbi:MAG: DUF4189 domain-containing protein, partial [Acidobacteriia bacterium]|nr:DUF4189 domain-containing protein [Terriglobia bacterium]